MDKEQDNDHKDIVKQYGDVFLDPQFILDNPPPLISVSPKIDLVLGGGVPEGCLFILTGPEKIGKTLTALQFAANAQKVATETAEKRRIYYANIEGRLKKRDLEGIRELLLGKDDFEIITSKKGNILSGEKYLSIIDEIVHQEPHSVAIIDSFSQLCSEEELVKDISEATVAPMNRFLAKFTRRFSNVLPINRVTLVGITHLMANIQKFGAGKSKVEKSGSSLKYAQDVKLYATHKEFIKQGETIIGQKVHWIVENSAINAPGSKVASIMKFGRGLWKEYEIIELAKDFGILGGSKSWIEMPNGKKYNGIPTAAKILEDDPDQYEELKKQVYEMVGM
jgi:recombination protein RecA